MQDQLTDAKVMCKEAKLSHKHRSWEFAATLNNFAAVGGSLADAEAMRKEALLIHRLKSGRKSSEKADALADVAALLYEHDQMDTVIPA